MTLGFEYADVFAGVSLVAARPEAAGRLAAAGVAPTAMALCGPAVAVADGPGEPARVDAAEWEVTSDDGRLCVSARRDRATPFVHTPTAIRGRISGEADLTFEGGP